MFCPSLRTTGVSSFSWGRSSNERNSFVLTCKWFLFVVIATCDDTFKNVLYLLSGLLSICEGFSILTEYFSWNFSNCSVENVRSRTITIFAHWWIESFSDFWMTFSKVLAIIAMSMFSSNIGIMTINIINTIIVSTGYMVRLNSSYCK